MFLSVLFPDLRGPRPPRREGPHGQSANYKTLVILQQVDLMGARRFFCRDELNFQRLLRLLPGLLRFCGRTDAASAQRFLEGAHVAGALSASQLAAVVEEAAAAGPEGLPDGIISQLCRFRLFQCLVFDCVQLEAECHGDELIPAGRHKSLETGRYIFDQCRQCVLAIGRQYLTVYDEGGEVQRHQVPLGEISQVLELRDCVAFEGRHH